jgi:hypothetical protein
MVQAYSVKAKKMVQVKNPVLTSTKNGRKCVKGVCPETGCKVCVFVKDDFSGEGLMDFLKPLVKKAGEAGLEALKKKAPELAKSAGEALANKAADAIKEKMKPKGKGMKGLKMGYC